MSERDKAIEMPDGWDGTPVIKLPVHYKNGFVIDADKQIVCNLLWNSHRVNYDARDQAGEYVANCINHAKQNAEAEKRLEEAVRSLEESIVDLRGYTITRHSLSALNIFNRAEEFLKQLDAIRAVYTHLEQAEGGEESL